MQEKILFLLLRLNCGETRPRVAISIKLEVAVMFRALLMLQSDVGRGVSVTRSASSGKAAVLGISGRYDKYGKPRSGGVVEDGREGASSGESGKAGSVVGGI